MKTSKRLLTKWRREALKASNGEYPADAATILFEDFCQRILVLTQELLDQKLLEEVNKR